MALIGQRPNKPKAFEEEQLPLVYPPKWSRAQLEEARDEAQTRFVEERVAEGVDAFYAELDKAEIAVRQALKMTDDLLRLRGEELLESPTLWNTLRYFCAPPVSEEDLWTMVGRKFKSTVKLDIAHESAQALAKILDRRRFTWLPESRRPTWRERHVAIGSTAFLLAHERFKTARRKRIAATQESAAVHSLLDAGLILDPSRTPMCRLDDLSIGYFSGERKITGGKCDIIARLSDGRLLAIECKVSNGPKNSWKRLHREVGGKAERLRKKFGAKVITGAVIAGVFDLSCLEKSQSDHGVYLFWGHDLRPLTTFIRSVT